MQHHITIPLPAGAGITVAKRVLAAVEMAAIEALGDVVEARISDGLELSDQERRTICALIDTAMAAEDYAAYINGDHTLTREPLIELRDRVSPDSPNGIVSETIAEQLGVHDLLSRPQELARDAERSEK